MSASDQDVPQSGRDRASIFLTLVRVLMVFFALAGLLNSILTAHWWSRMVTTNWRSLLDSVVPGHIPQENKALFAFVLVLLLIVLIDSLSRIREVVAGTAKPISFGIPPALGVILQAILAAGGLLLTLAAPSGEFAGQKTWFDVLAAWWAENSNYVAALSLFVLALLASPRAILSAAIAIVLFLLLGQLPIDSLLGR